MDAVTSNRLDNFTTGWIVSLMIFLLTLSPLSDLMLEKSGLPFILSDMVLAFVSGLILAFIQSRLLKPFITVPRWLSNTTISAVAGAFLVGALTIFAESTSTLSVSANIPLIYMLIAIGFAQASSLPDTFRHRWLWMLPYALMSICTVAGFWGGAIFAVSLHPMLVSYYLSKRKKRKNSEYQQASSRLTEYQVQIMSQAQISGNQLSSVNKHWL